MGLRLTDTGNATVVTAGSAEIFRYVYRPSMPPDHVPRPYLHPVRTLGGTVVTGVRPDDHPWHYGISIAVAMMGGSSFWGGPTYVNGRGYVPLDNHGTVTHERWITSRADALTATLRHRLIWRGHSGAPLVWEDRTLIARVGETGWTLGVRLRMRNVGSDPLRIDSPSTAGRASAGYGGLFVRAAEQFRGGDISDDEGHRGDDAFGGRARRLSMRSSGAAVTISGDGKAREPWFFRRDEYPGMGPALAFRQPLAIPPGGTLARTYQIAIDDV